MMKILVVTGGIGSGKSEVCRILGELGVRYIYDADSKAKELYVSHKTLLKDIEDQLGQSFCHEGVFQPRLLAARIFSDKSALAKVEELLFPAMIEDFNQFTDGAGQDEIVVFESATILEATAVFSTGTTLTPGKSPRKSAHWPMACSWE